MSDGITLKPGETARFVMEPGERARFVMEPGLADRLEVFLRAGRRVEYRHEKIVCLSPGRFGRSISVLVDGELFVSLDMTWSE